MDDSMQGPVPLTADVALRCRCGGCPVQARSDCRKSGMADLMENLKKEPLRPAELPVAYCASGRATCADVDFHKACACGTCDIFNEGYHLADDQPAGYFCKGGAAR